MHCVDQETNMQPYFTYMSYMPYISITDMGIFVQTCAMYKSLASTIWLEALYTYFINYISCWHISLIKYGCQIANIGNTDCGCFSFCLN